MPSESGVTSSNSMFFTPWSRMLACTAAPSATTSSGFSSICGLRSKKSWTVRGVSGVRGAVAADQRRARGAADENDFVHVRGLELGVRKRLFDRPHGAINYGTNKSVEGAAREIVREHVAIWQRKAEH